MESANLGHHQHQQQQQQQLPDQVVGSPHPLLLVPLGATPSCYGFGSTTHHTWSSSPTTTTTTPSTFNINNSFGNTINPNYNYDVMVSSESSKRAVKSSRDNIDHHDNIISINSSNMVNLEFGFPWTNCNPSTTTTTSTTVTHDQSASYDMNLAAKIEEESESSFPKFTEILNSCTSTTTSSTSPLSNSTNHVNNDDYAHFFLKPGDLSSSTNNNNSSISSSNVTDHHHHHKNLMVKTLSYSTAQQVVNVENQQISSSTTSEFDSNNNNNNNNNNMTGGSSFGGLMAAVGSRGQFSQIYPSINISNLFNKLSPSPSSNISVTCSLDINSIGHDHHHNQSFRESTPSNNFCGSPLQLHQMHLPQRPSSGLSKRKPSFINSEITVAKRGGRGSLIEPKIRTMQSAPNKKPRTESRSACPPFKVRKEKLGDRIAALQQLVSPFGKTDTASVLMEAIGYIKFLQNQVETLSVPYMKSSRKKIIKSTQRGVKEDYGSVSDEKGDLRSRGLCLVPLSCMSYVTGDGGGGSMWPN